MKRMIALIVSLLLILVCLSSALAETAGEETAAEETAVTETAAEEKANEASEEGPASLPQQIAAGSVEEFLGEWKMTGIVYGGTFYDIEQMIANKFIAEASDRVFTITDDKKASLTYLGTSMVFDYELNEATGVLMLKNNQGEGTLFLQDDGTMALSEEGADVIAIFAKAVKEEAAE